jgi:uncharacterized protein YecT (DUF1311 family)
MGQSSDSQIAALTSSQKKWIAYRDDNCTFEDSLAFGGTATGGNYSGCLCALSYERIGDFERIRRQVFGRTIGPQLRLESLEKARILVANS